MNHETTFGDSNQGFQLGVNYGSVTNEFHSHGDRQRADQACLRDLKTSDPREDKDRIEEIKGGLLKDAFQWVLDNDEFNDWRKDEGKRILWIKGNPGKGKTMLLCGLLDEMPKLDTESELAFVFCQANNAHMNDATAVLRGIIYMLVTQKPALLHHVGAEYDKSGKDLFEGINGWWALVKIFTSILEQLPKACIVVDALDECTSNLTHLLDLISSKTAIFPRVKWIVSSRPWPVIEERLKNEPRKLVLSLEDNDKPISSAVAKYVGYKVSELAKLKGHDSTTQEAIRTRLLSGAEGTFLWVALVFEDLANAEPWNEVQVLDSLPQGLDALYRRMVNKINDSKDSKLYKQILSVILTVYRPITIDEVFHLADLFETRSQAYSIAIIESCGSFLVIRRGTIFFVHQSAPEYLLQNARDEILSTGVEFTHSMIARQSLRTLSKELKRDMYDIKDPGCLIDDIKKPEPDPLTPVRYACIAWVDHLEAALAVDSNDASDSNSFFGSEGLVAEFLSHKYLTWLEALSILGSVFEGISAMLKLEGLLKKMDNLHSLSLQANDASRFIRYHRPAIERNPLQVYYSALIFTPSRSLIRVNYKCDIPTWILNEPMRAAHWSRCIQVLQENTACIYSVAWGPNGELASGSRDKMVRTWDPNTGKCLATLEGHEDTVVSVAWSKSGVLASGSIDGTIKIWDTAMRQCVATLKDGKSKVLSIDWSPGGVLLCSGCENGVIKIWDTAIGECKSSLKADIDNVGSVSWGRDGRLATFCHGVMRVWNPLTGECLSIISGCGEGIRSIAWSTDGRIGTGSNSHIPAVWSPRSELCLASFKGHEYSVTSVAWSSKGIFASGSLDETIKFWDPRTGRHIETIEGHGDSIMSIDWSEDGKLVSASSDGTIRLWDTTGIEDQPFLTWIFYRILFMIWSAFATFVWCIAQGQDRKKPISWTNYSTGMTHNPLTDRFEPIKIHKSDKTRMILASTFWAVLFFRSRSMITFGLYFMSIVTTCSILWKCRIVRIWVPHEGSGIFIRPIDGEQKSVTCLAWSPDNKLLASGSRDATVKIWNAKTGQCILTLEGHSSWARCVAWSPKMGLLASGSLDGTVRIWDSVSGECTKIIEVGEPVLDLSWSFDGNLLVTVSMTTKEGIKNTIRVWTKNTMECIFVLDDTDKDGVSFDLENPNLLHTSAGTFDIRSGHVVKHSSQFSTRPLFEESQYALNEDLSWVTRQGKKLIFLPLEYRSHIWCSNDTTVAVGCSSGEVLIMCLSTMNKFW